MWQAEFKDKVEGLRIWLPIWESRQETAANVAWAGHPPGTIWKRPSRPPSEAENSDHNRKKCFQRSTSAMAIFRQQPLDLRSTLSLTAPSHRRKILREVSLRTSIDPGNVETDLSCASLLSAECIRVGTSLQYRRARHGNDCRGYSRCGTILPINSLVCGAGYSGCSGWNPAWGSAARR